MNKSSEKLVFLADDDVDDCMLFQDALNQVSGKAELTMAKDGQQLMQILNEKDLRTPDVIFLDLNMPCKNGFECLEEIKQNERLKKIPIVIFSTSTQNDTIDRVYKQGADFYICKPGTFLKLKTAIEQVLSIDWHEFVHPSKENFVLQL